MSKCNGERIHGPALWSWMVAAMFAPAAGVLGSAPWPWVLALGLGSMGGFLAMEMLLPAIPAMGKVLSGIQYEFLILSVGVTLRSVGDCWTTAVTPWVLPVCVLVLAACGAAQGLQSASRSGATLFWFVAAAFLVLTAFALGDMQVQYLYPEKLNIRARDLAVFLIPGMTLLMPREKGKNPWRWALVIVAAGTIIALVTAGAMSYAVAKRTNGAYFQMVRGIKISGVAERFESVVSATMTISWFCLLTLILSVAGSMANRVAGKSQSAGVWISAALGAVVWIAGQRLPQWPLTLGSLLLWYVVPLFKGALAAWKRQKRKTTYRKE